MGAEIAVRHPDPDRVFANSYCCTYRALDDLTGIFIRAAISYLKSLSTKNLSRQLLVEEGILDATTAPNSDEVVLITNYRLRIKTAIRLLNSWCREKTGNDSNGLSFVFPFFPTAREPEFEIPISDSMMPQGITIEMLHLSGLDQNYRLERIPKTLPPVLGELKLQGVHHYVAYAEDFSYEKAQDMVAFLDKVMPYLMPQFARYEDPDTEPIGQRLRAPFAACPPGGEIIIT